MRKLIYSLIFLLFHQFTLAQKQEVDNIKIVTSKTPFTIVIDAGHGGKDVGKEKGKSLKHEKDLNLDIALRLGGYIEERIKNVTVLYTRKTDRTVSLDERVSFANHTKADFFISIHCNSLPLSSYQGTQCHIQSKQFGISYELAKRIEKEFGSRAGRKSRGVKDRNDRGHNLQVLQYTNMPAVLVECGFMSNPSEEKFLTSGKGQTLISSAIFRALRDYILENPKPQSELRFPYYKIQIASSKKKLNVSDFKKVGMRVDIIEDKNTPYKYRYMVGKEYKERFANELLKKVKKKGYKDAFVVSFTKSKNNEIKPSDDFSKPYYSVQIMSSVKKVDTKSKTFSKIGYPVDIIEYNDSTKAFRFQYLVGKTYEKSEADKIMKTVRKKGFKDAFVIKIQKNPSL